MALAKQPWLPFPREGGEASTAKSGTECPIAWDPWAEFIARTNLQHASHKVQKNGGAPGIDGMTVEELPRYLLKHWERIRTELCAGRYRPSPVKRVEIPKPSGGMRKLGIPTVVDRFIQQALLQVLQREWDPTFSDASFGFRPGRSAAQAIRRAQQHVRDGYKHVVDVDLEKFFDHVNHDLLMGLVCKRIKDRRIRILIRSFLKAGVLYGDVVTVDDEGTPQGGPLSPLLSNLMLNEFDRELEKRGLRFVRYADDCTVYVKSKRAAWRVLTGLIEFLEFKLKLRVNLKKSHVGRPWNRKFLGFLLDKRRDAKIRISPQTLDRFKARVRELTGRKRGISLRRMIDELTTYLRGWKGYYGACETPSILLALDRWIRRRLRSMIWVQWGRSGYRQLRKRGVKRQLAWDTSKSAHGPWRISFSPALHLALPDSYFRELGLPQLDERAI